MDLSAENAIEQVRGTDGVMWRWIHVARDKIKAGRILQAIERYLGIPVYPDHSTAWHYDEKLTQYFVFKALGVPMPGTWLFWDEKRAKAWADRTEYPKVFKLSCGAASENVAKVNSRPEALRLINAMFRGGICPKEAGEVKNPARIPRWAQLKGVWPRAAHAFNYLFLGQWPPPVAGAALPERGYAYFQEFLPGNSYDTRVVVIGGRAFGFRRLNRPGDFRASGSGKNDPDPEKIDKRCIQMAFEISEKLDSQSMAYDFLMKDGEPVLTEMSYTFIDRLVWDCPGYWRRDLSWVPGHKWPEEAQVEDFLAALSRTKNVKSGFLE